VVDRYKVLAYSPQDGWNLRGVHPTHTAARAQASAEEAHFRYVAVVLVRGRTARSVRPIVAILGTNARHLLHNKPLPEGFRTVALAL
jgi:hypothetical protein